MARVDALRSHGRPAGRWPSIMPSATPPVVPLVLDHGGSVAAQSPEVSARVAVVVSSEYPHFGLLEAIQSVIAQSHAAAEIVVIADNQPDFVIMAPANKPRVATIVRGAWSAAKARNLVLQQSDADQIVFLTQEHRLLPDALAHGVAAFHRCPDAAFVFGNWEDEAIATMRQAPDRPAHAGGQLYIDLIKKNLVGACCVVMYRRSALLASGGFDVAYGDCMDYAAYLNLARDWAVYDHAAPVAAGRRPGAVSSGRRHAGGSGEYRAVLAQVPRLGKDRALYAAPIDQRVMNELTQVALDVVRRMRERRWKAMRAMVADLLAYIGVLLRHRPSTLAKFCRREFLPWFCRRRPALARLLQPFADNQPQIEYDATLAIPEIVEVSASLGDEVLIVDPNGTNAYRFKTRAVTAFSGDAEKLVEALDADRAAATCVVVPPNAFRYFDRLLAILRPATRASLLPIWADAHCRIYRHEKQDRPAPQRGKVLVAGHFSFEHGHATAGDIMVRDVVTGWLCRAGRRFDIALAPPFLGGVRWESLEARDYSHVVFACGPLDAVPGVMRFLEHFNGCRFIGINLSMLRRLEEWNPFDVLLERDSSARSRPDLAFLSAAANVPIVGVCLREHASGTRQAEAAIRRLTTLRNMAVVNIDTRLDLLDAGSNSTGLRSAAEIESLLARMDVVLTTRLHGLVLSLKNGVPAIAIDPGNEVFKISKQANAIQWPIVFDAMNIDESALLSAFNWCLTAEARVKARECAGLAVHLLGNLEGTFIDSVRSGH